MGPDAPLLLLLHVHHQHIPHLVGRACQKQVLGVVAHRDQVVGLLLGELVGRDHVQHLQREEINEVDLIRQRHHHFFESYLHGKDVGLEGDIRNNVVAIWVEGGVLSSKIAMRYDTKAEF